MPRFEAFLFFLFSLHHNNFYIVLFFCGDMTKDYIKTTGSVVLPYCLNGKDGFVYVKTKKDGQWGLPAGKLNLFEDGQDGTMREVFQETGLESVVVSFLGIWDFKSERGSSVSNRIYLGKVVGGYLEISRPDEIEGLGVFSIGEIRGLRRTGSIRAGKANLGPVESYLAGEIYPLSVIKNIF